MTVHAHPDDESSKGAATSARYVRDGVDVLVVTCTDGSRGDILNPQLKKDPAVQAEIEANLLDVRRKEMDTAREILGVRQEWLGFVDSGLPEGDPLPPLPEGCFALQDLETAAEPLVRLIRQQRPQVIVTYNENGGYPHPDHIMTHKVTVAAFDAAGDPAKYPDAGEPWQPLKLYYDVAWSMARLEAEHQELLDRGLESPYWELLKERQNWPQREITTRVQAGEYFEIRDAALKAHATQIDPDGPFFRTPNDVKRAVWPTEDFELARSLIDTTLPEDDLFAGVREYEKAQCAVSGQGVHEPAGVCS
ncbi:mycothiol conjugate amidase Mca [Catenulispora sp. NF23]|uniref:Mycothiol S-conjugate amidase n=2 Tax=Catenulispora pinistramenti TaxID=2705254 RepID=A0ABS5L715_9ACTN|nr:mycothiol conjugate amidase Mca [Catenulispora pinistramenti]MBS2554109.1 mycothiol conjugate amidase Mca [Catenulispora pinistramenti]